MEYIYPAVFESNTDGSYTISFPDLPGCISEGKSLSDALHMAQRALEQWIEYLKDESMDVPSARDILNVEAPSTGFVNLVTAETKDMRAVRRTVSLPQWMDDAAINAGLSLSKVLQDALSSRIG